MSKTHFEQVSRETVEKIRRHETIEAESVRPANGPAEHWMRLCEQASVEQDPDTLLELVRQINSLLEQKYTSLSIRNSSAAD